MHLAPCGGKPHATGRAGLLSARFEDEAPIEIHASMHADAVEAGKVDKLIRSAARILHRAIHGIRGAREEMIQLYYSEVPSAENYFVAHIELHEGLANLKFRELQSLGSPLVSCEVPPHPALRLCP